MLYCPPPTVERFMLDDSLVRCVVGPIGSGKSMGSIMELLRRARQQAPDSSGARNTRFVCVRNTMQQLRATVLPDVQQYLKDMIRYFVTDATIQIRAELDDGTRVVSDWNLVPLDTKEDQRRLLSMQLTGAWINEVREVPIEIVQALMGRLGRFPSKVNGGPSWHGLIMDSNPWDVDSPYHDRFVLNPVPNWKLFHQPSGVGPHAENRDNLPDGYYENLASDRDEGWTEVHIYSEWGSSNAGQAVFRRSFDPKTHVVDMHEVINPFRPIAIGMDFGRTPAALIGQVDSMGRLLVFKEVTAEGVGLLAFLEEYLRPVLSVEPYAGKRVFVVADPAGREKSQLSEESLFDALRSLGFLAYPASTNEIETRLRSVERALRTTISGEPGLQISRTGCPMLVKALGSSYRYRRKRDGALEDVPEKNHPWSDVADALQYFCMGAAADLSGRVLKRDRPRAQGPKITAAAWT
jgi:hypothetical protein